MGTQILLYLILFLPWTTLFLVNKQTVKRYMPVTIFTSFLMTIIFQIAYQYNWWTIHKYIVPWGYMIDVSFAYGIFAVGTFWLFFFTFRNFWYYIAANALLDAILSFAVLPLLGVLGVATLDRIRTWQYFFVTLGLSVVLYFYQIWQDEIYRAASEQEGKKNRYFFIGKLNLDWLFKEKAK